MANDVQLPEPFENALAGDDDILLDQTYEFLERFFPWNDEQMLPSPGSPLRVARDVLFSDFMIREGGFKEFLCTELAGLATIADSFDAVGASVAAQVVRDALAFIPESIRMAPSSDQWRLVDEFASSTQAIDRMTDMNVDYLRQEPAAELLIAQYVRSHASDFAELFRMSENRSPSR